MYVIAYIYDILILPNSFGDMVILGEIFGDIVISRPLLGGRCDNVARKYDSYPKDNCLLSQNDERRIWVIGITLDYNHYTPAVM